MENSSTILVFLLNFHLLFYKWIYFIYELFNIFEENHDQNLGFIGFIFKRDFKSNCAPSKTLFGRRFSFERLSILSWNKPPLPNHPAALLATALFFHFTFLKRPFGLNSDFLVKPHSPCQSADSRSCLFCPRSFPKKTVNSSKDSIFIV
jgi:hypothetical protein